MITQREYIEKHQKFLSEKFIKDNPDGQFAIQRWGKKCVNLYVNFKRRTSHTSYLYPSAFGIECSNLDEFSFVSSQNNSFGRVTHYKTFDVFLRSCKEWGVTDKAIERFKMHYDDCRKLLSGEIDGDAAQVMIKEARKH